MSVVSSSSRPSRSKFRAEISTKPSSIISNRSAAEPRSHTSVRQHFQPQPPPPRSSPRNDGQDTQLNSDEIDELYVLEQVTPRATRVRDTFVPGSVPRQTTSNRDRAYLRRTSLPTGAFLTRNSARKARQDASKSYASSSTSKRQSVPASITSIPSSQAGQSFFSAEHGTTASTASRPRVSFSRLSRQPFIEESESDQQHDAQAESETDEVDEDDQDEPVKFESNTASVAKSRPGQRLRPSLSGPDGRLDIPTLEERCAVLVINAKSVLHFYMDLQQQGWKPDSLHQANRHWEPFESYKVNQLLAEGQYNHHFIDVAEVLQSLSIDDDGQPEGFQEAINMANCATFAHYVSQLPSPFQLPDGSIPEQAIENAPLRSISELNDARRVFLRWIVPFAWEISDQVLMMLLDMSTQIFIHRLQRNVEMVQAGELDQERAKTITSADLNDLESGEIVRHSLQRVKHQRKMTSSDIDRAVMRYETFANIRQIDLRELLYNYAAMRQQWSHRRMASDLTRYIRDVVRQVDAGIYSTSLPQIISRLNRESSRESSDLPDRIEASSVADGRSEEAESSPPGPNQSTPRASLLAKAPDPELEAFASQFPNWIQEMVQEADASKHAVTDDDHLDLSESQRAGVLAQMVGDTASQGRAEIPVIGSFPSSLPFGRSSSVDLAIPSSPPHAVAIDWTRSNPTTSIRTASVQTRQNAISSEQSESGDDTVQRLVARQDELIESPTSRKASRLGFDSENRLVRKSIHASTPRLIDGSAQGVRELRFDSQEEEERDIFLESATKRAKRKHNAKAKEKGKQRDARERPSDAEPEVTLAKETATTGRRSTRMTRAHSNTDHDVQPQIIPRTRSQKKTEEAKADPSRGASTRRSERIRAASAEPDNADRRVTRSRGMRHKQVEPVREEETQQREDELRAFVEMAREEDEDETRRTTLQRQRATIQNVQGKRDASSLDDEEEAAEVGRGATRPQRERRAKGDVARSNAQEPSLFLGQEPSSEGVHPSALVEIDQDLLNDQLRPSPEGEEDGFAGDDDPNVVAQRTLADQKLANRPVRPGTENFPLPRATATMSAEAIRPNHEPDSLEQPVEPRDVETVSAILDSSNPKKRRRIGPFRPERGDRTNREAMDDVFIPDEHYQLSDEVVAASTSRSTTPHAPPATTQASEVDRVRVEPYKGANLYITGGNLVGRQRWTTAETNCLLDALYELARFKKNRPRFQVYTYILKLYGPNGTRNRVLARWNNVQLKDKARNELIRMRREREKIPYWKRLLHPNLWEPKKNYANPREMTEEAPSESESDELVSSDDDDDDRHSENRNEEGNSEGNTRSRQTSHVATDGDGSKDHSNAETEGNESEHPDDNDNVDEAGELEITSQQQGF